MKRPALFLASAIACVVTSVGPTHASSVAEPTVGFDADLAMATFDSTWSIIHRTHFDADFEGVDWGAVREELRPRMAEVHSNEDLRGLLREMIARTNLSHFGLLNGDAVDALRDSAGDDPESDDFGDADVGIAVRLLGDDVVVWKVRPGSSADRAGVHAGWIVDRIGERALDEAVAKAREAESDSAHVEILVWTLVTSLLQGAEGSSVQLQLRDGEDTARTLDLEREEAPGVVNQLGNLPPMRASLQSEEREVDGARIGVIAFNIWLLPVMAEFDAAIDRFRDADGLVIDLRGNIGGVGAMVMGMAGHLMDERTALGTMKTRASRLEFRANPRRTNAAGERVQPFSGPVAILVDPMSMSTSEIFARGLQVVGRARVFGERSPGAALPSQLTRLPNGDVLQHAFADFVDPEGTRLEGRGVPPDVEVPLTRQDLLAGRDAPMLSALRWIVGPSGSQESPNR